MAKSNQNASASTGFPRLRSALAVGLLLSGVQAADPIMPAGPWTDVYNGKDLTGWSSVGSPPWTIVGGNLECKGFTTSKTHLIWKDLVKDVEISATYKLSSASANSGIQVRSHCTDRTKSPPTCGGTYQVCGIQLDVAKDYSGRLFEECVGFYDPKVNHTAACMRTIAVGTWMTTVARFDGANVSLWLNGVHCLDHTLTQPYPWHFLHPKPSAL
jgi:hypothetical protein